MRPPTRLDCFLSSDPASTFDHRDEVVEAMKNALRDAREEERRQSDRKAALGERSPVGRVIESVSASVPFLNAQGRALAAIPIADEDT
ncbi:MAG TPA: hypothetical protein VGQ36_04245 [Thermoanaerobaculia bacterium]|jgi:hypothetical protein|nr:hypothetical protein [Thermoanaerobaculia bacterium]